MNQPPCQKYIQEEALEFENEVRRVASALFPRATVNGPVILDGRERDGVFDDGEIIHIVEATTSSKKEKADYDLRKSADLVKALRRERQDVNFKIWFVTRREPTADQMGISTDIRKISKCPVEICSYRKFSSKLVDAGEYLHLRENHPFGSVRNPEDDSDFRVPEREYIPIDLLDFITKETTPAASLGEILSTKPDIYLLVGDFGSGKSMTMRHAYYSLKKRYLSGESTTFPLYLNLRDHFGQKSPAEALLRHGEEIGFPLPSQLVSAWKAGHCHVFLDGFDELSSTRLVRGVGGLRQARRESMRLVHEFTSNHPQQTSLFISGRQHYFDSIEELKSALGLKGDFKHFTMNEFTQNQVETYLSRKGYENTVPNWLPSRPLLLGYLAIKGVLSTKELDLSALSREEGWDYLLDRVCEREARQIDPVSIDPHAVREFVERLASVTRQTNSGRGPIHLNDIHRIFQDVFAMPPDEKAATLIFRMPGLTCASGQEDTREFIDDDYVDACRSGDVCRFIDAPHDVRLEAVVSSTVQMRDLGCALAAHKQKETSDKKISTALHNAADKESPCLSVDIIRIMQHLDLNYVGPPIYINDGFFDEFEVTNHPYFHDVYFNECYFGKLDIPEGAGSFPAFNNCEIDNLYGCIGPNDLPPGIQHTSNTITRYVDEAQTNSDILSLPLPTSTRVLMTILRKIFIQAGRGRKENALYRGLDNRSKVYVCDVLNIIEQLGIAHPHKINGPTIWFPNRSKTKEIHEILQSPQTSDHPLAIKVRNL